MFVNKHVPLACLIGFACLAGCSQSSATPGVAAHADIASPINHSGPAQPGDDDDNPPVTHIDCGRIFSPADVAGILKGKVTISVYDMRDNACEFESADGESFTLYSGSDFTDEIAFKQAVANRNGEYKALAGVGDQAFYRGNREFMSRKGNYYCAISGSGGNPPSVALARKLGALCNKIFASR